MNQNCTDVITKVFLADGSTRKESPAIMAQAGAELSSVSSSMALEKSPKIRMVNLNSERKSHENFLDRSIDTASHVRKSSNAELRKQNKDAWGLGITKQSSANRVQRKTQRIDKIE